MIETHTHSPIDSYIKYQYELFAKSDRINTLCTQGVSLVPVEHVHPKVSLGLVGCFLIPT